MSTTSLLRIGGESRDSRIYEDVLNPFDQSVVGSVCVGRAGDMDDAIALADRAFKDTKRMPTHQRSSILARTAALLEERAEWFAKLMVSESGKPIRFCHGEVTRACMTFRLASGACMEANGQVLPADIEARSEGRLLMYTQVPRGPVAAIAPFNFPLNLIAHKIAPAIAAGASVVLKPPPQCPLTALALGALLDEAGMPPETLSVVHCPPDVAQRMVEDHRMKVLSFTGSDAVGWKLKALAGKKQVLLELGGNAPCIVDETADLDAAMAPIVMGAWANAGQVCIKVQHILVAESRYREFLERFVRESKAVACGDPTDARTIVGPLIEPQHVTRVLSWIDEAVAAGAQVHCGATADGAVLRPTVLTEVPDSARVCRDEVFGPVTVVRPFRTFDEAIERCNSSRFGLQAGVFTMDISRAMRAYRELEYGGVMINEVPTFRVDHLPYGGTKDSGFGREGVRFAMQEMSEPKVLMIRELPDDKGNSAVNPA